MLCRDNNIASPMSVRQQGYVFIQAERSRRWVPLDRAGSASTNDPCHDGPENRHQQDVGG